MVSVQDVHKSFGSVHAVRGVSFELRPGQIAGLLGPNGAGKTTTIRMIAGYHLPDRGQVMVGGHDTALAPAPARRRVGYLPETTPLYPEMKVREYLAYRARLFGIAYRFRARSIAFAIERCSVADVASRRIGALSKGYKQRVGLAAALIHNPQVLILDEPTNGLDPSQIRESRELVRELAKDRTMLVCSHILPEVEKLCDRVLVLVRGQLRADGAPSDLTRLSGGKYVVHARESRMGDSERTLKAWQSLPHVTNVTAARPSASTGSIPTISWTEWTITTRPGAADIREQIWNAAHEMGLTLRELRSESPTLESVFVRLLEEADASPPAANLTPAGAAP